jgi:transcription elongation factor GreA-like protein
LNSIEVDNFFYENLFVGECVDYFYVIRDKDKSKEIGLWTRAELVEKSQGGKSQIKLLGNGLKVDIEISKSWIAPVGQFSTDFEWRNNLVQGDLVDVFHKGWYLCKITEVNQKSKIAKLIIVCLENKDISADDLGSLSVFSPMLRKPLQFSKEIQNRDDIKVFPFDSEKFNFLETFSDVK